MDTIIYLDGKREMFWDDYLVQPELTTAQRRLQQPVFRETVFWLDQTVENSSISYPCILRDPEGYRLYYGAWHKDSENRSRGSICVLLSKDGKTWQRPNLGIYEWEGSRDNNIVLSAEEFRDNAFFFYDTNPDCPPQERYKCLADGRAELKKGLWYFSSADGYHWQRRCLISVCGQFDTLNTAHWNGNGYTAYIRNYHNIKMDGVTGQCTAEGVIDINDHFAPVGNKNSGIRDIRVMYSQDFIHWTTPKRLQYRDGRDLPMYTNNVIPCPEAPHILLGFPTRYHERKAWTPNYDQLPDPEYRKELMRTDEPRSGLAITDCLFMWSRDGENWERTSEAFLTPGYEQEYNWVYGDCYLAYNIVDNEDGTVSLYTIDRHRCPVGTPKPLNRYTLRKDGFACYAAGGDEAVLVTKPLRFCGTKLLLNFSTSAYGHIYVEVLDAQGQVLSEKSVEVFGDHVKRQVFFADGTDFSRFAGKPVRLRFTMLEAKLYTMQFE